MQNISRVNQDYIVSYLRCQADILNGLLEGSEGMHEAEYGYMIESIRQVEVDLKRLRKFLED